MMAALGIRADHSGTMAAINRPGRGITTLMTEMGIALILHGCRTEAL